MGEGMGRGEGGGGGAVLVGGLAWCGWRGVRRRLSLKKTSCVFANFRTPHPVFPAPKTKQMMPPPQLGPPSILLCDLRAHRVVPVRPKAPVVARVPAVVQIVLHRAALEGDQAEHGPREIVARVVRHCFH